MLPTNNHSSYLSSVSGRKPIRSNAFAAQFYDGQNTSNWCVTWHIDLPVIVLMYFHQKPSDILKTGFKAGIL